VQLQTTLPREVDVSFDIETRNGRAKPYRARARWTDPATGRRISASEGFAELPEANAWVSAMREKAEAGITPRSASVLLAEYGERVIPLVTRDLESKTLDPYLAGWKLRIRPSLGHLQVRRVTHGAVDRTVDDWISDGHGLSTVKNTLSMLVRIMEQAYRDGLITGNPARILGLKRRFKQVEDELLDPRALALPDFHALFQLADTLVERSFNRFRGWGDVVVFTACTAARIGEVSGVRRKDIDRDTWTWNVRRQTTPAPGGLLDKGTKGNYLRRVPIIREIRPMVAARLDAVHSPDGRLFTGPRGGRISTAVLRDATHWDEVVTKLGFEHLRRHDLRHTGLTWLADAGVLMHVLQSIAGHGSITTTQRYLHPDRRAIEEAGNLLSTFVTRLWSPSGPQPIMPVDDWMTTMIEA